MFLWRIAFNALPTKDNLSQRMHIDNPTCVLCGSAPKSTCHLFILCSVARAIWFTSCWGLRADEHNIVDCPDIVKLILDPLKSSNPDLDGRLISSTMAHVINDTCYLKNQDIFQDGQVDVPSSSSCIQRKSFELSKLIHEEAPVFPQPLATSWSPPPVGSKLMWMLLQQHQIQHQPLLLEIIKASPLKSGQRNILAALLFRPKLLHYSRLSNLPLTKVGPMSFSKETQRVQ